MRPGTNVLVGRTHSIHAAVDGHVKFERKAEGRVHISVVPLATAAE
jgi:large subunit ribosomal protein L27